MGLIKSLPDGRVNIRGEARDVRGDHVARYTWAADRLNGHVVDAGCNCGYGAAILADNGLTVTAADTWVRGLDYARAHWHRPAIEWLQMDFTQRFELPLAQAVVAFEIVEHLADPVPLLTEARRVAGRLLASVPNEAVWPHEARLYPVHQRHYTREQFEELLERCGWCDINWLGQAHSAAPVTPETNGRTLVVDCR